MNVNYFQIFAGHVLSSIYLKADMQYANEKCKKPNILSTNGLKVNKAN